MGISTGSSTGSPQKVRPKYYEKSNKKLILFVMKGIKGKMILSNAADNYWPGEFELCLTAYNLRLRRVIGCSKVNLPF
jgi:hypothetical protein